MKYLILFCLFFLIFNSCKKDEKINENSVQKDSLVIKKDSVSLENPPLKVEPLDISAEVGKTIFSQDKNVLFYFNTRTNSGEIKLNGKSYNLDMLNFIDNNYYISGDYIKISAKDGNFQEMTSDCLYGNFPEVKVEVGKQELILKNISVQDCPAY
ncbi:hypothetical protein [Halpernia sp.]|uniref:hypothetical protein n=1 Tax=Halpernia sp. TaxID=2782209 RepID=UPI003A937E9E